MGRKGKGHVPAPISSFISTGVIICIRKCSQKSQYNKLIRAFHISSKENQVNCLTTQQAASPAKDFRECSVLSCQTRQLLIELCSPGPGCGSAGRWLASSQLFLFQGIALDLQPLNNLRWSGNRMNKEFCGPCPALAVISPARRSSHKAPWGKAEERVSFRIHLGISNGCANTLWQNCNPALQGPLKAASFNQTLVQVQHCT